MTTIHFFVAGKPEPAGSKRAFVLKGGAHAGRAIITDANSKSKPWQSMVKFEALAARSAISQMPFDGPIQLDATFTVLRPKGHYGSGKNAHKLKDSAPAFPTSKPDVLKLTRGIEDAMTGIVYTDDSQIVAEHLFKVYGEREGVEISVAPYVESLF